MLAVEQDGRRGLRETPVLLAGAAAAIIAGATVPLLSVPHAAAAAALAAAVVGGAVVAGPARALAIVGSVAYVASLQWAYVDWVVPFYAYSGLISSDVDAMSLLLIVALAALPALWLPTSLRRPSDIVLWFLYLFGYVPAVAIPIHLLGPGLWGILPFTVLVALSFAALGLVHRIPPLRATWPGLSERAFTGLLVVAGLVSTAYLLVIFGIPTGVPDFASVYDTRAAYAEVASGTPGAGYLVPWAGNVIYPFLMALGLARGRWWLLAFGAGGELLIYATTGFKTVLFSIALVPIIYVLIRLTRRGFGVLLAWSGAAVVVGSVVGTIVTGSIWPLALFVTRLLAVPGQMTAYYLDFFTSNPTYELSRSFLASFNASPYDLEAPNLIGALFLDDVGINANANIWADAVANFGLAGIIPFTLVLGATLWLLDSVGARRSLLVVGPTLGLAGITLGNGAVFTSILTLGIGLTIGLIALLPEDRASVGDEPRDETAGGDEAATRPRRSRPTAPRASGRARRTTPRAS